MSDYQVKTIQDMVKLHYSEDGFKFLMQDSYSGLLQKDAAVLTTTTGPYNAQYGAASFIQLNMEDNTFRLLPKVPFGRTGMRVITARSTTLPYGGQGEDAALPATTKPTWAIVAVKPKHMVANFENSAILEYLATEGAGEAVSSMSDLKLYFAKEHAEDINAALNQTNGTLSGNNFESIDRLVGSYAEFTNCKQEDEATGYTAGDLDPYASASFDRDGGAGWTDAYVNYSSTSTTAGLRNITDTILMALIQNTAAAGANTDGQFFQTGWDTWAAINTYFEPAARYNIMGVKPVKVGLNGVQSPEGYGVGTQVSTLYNRPLFISKDTVKESCTGGISRIFLLDASNPEGEEIPRLAFKMAMLPTYFEAGIKSGNPFAINKIGTEGMYLTMGELVCRFFKVQGKARDLKG